MTKPAFPELTAAIDHLRASLGTPVAVWHYTPSFSVVRFENPDGGKTYRPFWRDADGWRPGVPPKPWPLFTRPNPLPPNADPIVVVEGEKCANLAHSIGLCAVTSAGGAGGAANSDWAPLRGKRVIIFPDNDEPGRKYGREVASILAGINAHVRLFAPKALPEGGDIEEWIAMQRRAGRNNGQLRCMIITGSVEWETQK